MPAMPKNEIIKSISIISAASKKFIFIRHADVCVLHLSILTGNLEIDKLIRQVERAPLDEREGLGKAIRT
jgi:hypothetical protein